MNMRYIRDYYQVPAKRGAKIKFRGQPYVIIGARDARLRAKPVGPDGVPKQSITTVTLHPTWEVEYSNGEE